MWSNNQSDGIETTDLRVKLNSKIPDLREKLKRCKTDRSKAEPETFVPHQRKTQDLRTNDVIRERASREISALEHVHGKIPPGNDSVRYVKGFLRKAITAKQWPTTPEASPKITFSAEDAAGVHMPHNDSFLVDIGISD
uniref:Uncharacterized protein n=1 Tax=Brassica oleracea var. oleracea TaxID=109376 RepID=A0A0D3AV43_BRAOL